MAQVTTSEVRTYTSETIVETICDICGTHTKDSRWITGEKEYSYVTICLSNVKDYSDKEWEETDYDYDVCPECWMNHIAVIFTSLPRKTTPYSSLGQKE